jgi:transcriptional regulator with XRE-family HTH domain
MAEALGVSQSAYSRIESGDTNITAWQLRVCADQLGLVPSQLLAQVEAHERLLNAQGVAIVAEKKTNPVAVVLGLALLAALVSRA